MGALITLVVCVVIGVTVNLVAIHYKAKVLARELKKK